MNKIKQTLIWCVAFTVFSVFQISQAYAQENITVKGSVVDDKNEPLIGVSVGISGGKGGTRTDVNGNFQLSVPATTKSLKFSYIGFDNKAVAISANMKVELKGSSNELESVVVTGYATVKKKELTSAIASVSSKDFNQGNVTNSILQIQGKVSGLSIVQSSGDPNSEPTIRLRGQTSLFGNQTPLVVVDGVQLENIGQLSNIPPGDIETYDVLKDASATSIYGSRGANGVIIVTTKKGANGQTKVDYQGFAAFENQAKSRNLLTGDEWIAAVEAAKLPIPQDQNNVANTNTNWEKELVRQAYTQSHTASISAGSKTFNYRGSLNYINQDNIVINSGKEQMGIRFNAQQKAFNDKLVLDLGISNTITNRKNVSVEQQFANQLSPRIPLLDSIGGENEFLTGSTISNIVRRQKTILNNSKESFTQYTGAAKLELLPGFKAGVAGTMGIFNNNRRYFRPEYGQVDSEGKGKANNQARRDASTNETYRGEINASYDHSWGKHNFNALSVYEYNYFTDNSFFAQADSIPYEYFLDNALQASIFKNRKIESTRAENKIISLLGKLNYNYDNKYYITGSIRRDGASKFGVNNRWGNFVATNVAWRITQENFMKEVLWINDLKLRLGYGETGNQDGLGQYQSLRLREVKGNVNIGQGNEEVQYKLFQNENPDLQWEVRKGRNIGIDFAFFNSRLSGDINYFNDITDKLLYEYESAFALPLPATGSRPEGKYVTANVGKLTNKGLELALNFRAVQKKDFSWTVSGQISGVRTKIKSLQDASGKYSLKTSLITAGRQNFTGLPLTFLKEGEAPYIMRLPKFLGLDTAGKQIIEPDSIAGFVDPSPKFNYGINNSFTYKNWSLSFFIRGVSGIKIYNSNAQNISTNVNVNFLAGFNTTKDGLETGIKDVIRVSDRWLENASFIRLDNATLGYTFKKFKGVQNLRVYVASNNLFVITKFKGLDPEVQSAGNFQAGGTENYMNNQQSTPRTRSFSFGVNASF